MNVSGDSPEYEHSPSELGDEGSPELKALPLAAARHLEDQSHAIGPLLFETLCEDQRPLLMEVACSPESLLSESVMEVTGRRLAATRCGLFNACDLSTPEGVRHVLCRIRTEGPRNVWISPPCGPYSPMQHVNQRTESQKQELQTKRREAQAIYAGTAVVVHFCKQLGIHVTVEMSERCLAWRLPLFQDLQHKHGLMSAVIKGCRVGLRDPKSGKLLQKGWRILTSHARLAQEMHLPCRCHTSYEHAKCEGGLTKLSAYYTPIMTKRVARLLQQELSEKAFLMESQGQSMLPEGFGEGEFCVCDNVTTSAFLITIIPVVLVC